jgi:hypothetical protein
MGTSTGIALPRTGIGNLHVWVLILYHYHHSEVVRRRRRHRRSGQAVVTTLEQRQWQIIDRGDEDRNMALRLGGTYLLAGTALRSQSRVAYHLSRMEKTASEAIVLDAASDAELESSLVLRGESAIDSEEGLTLQGEAAEHELDAEREFLASEVEYAAGDGFDAEAGEMRASAERDALESEASFAESEAADLESSALRGRAEVEGEESASDSGRSVAYWEGSTNAGRVATSAEEGAAEYGAVAAGDAASGLGDGEALARAEAGAMEDAEVMAACAPIPVLNLVCEAVGSIVEVGYQSIAAFEGAKAAVDGVSAAMARGRERTELVLAVEKREEAARLALEAERLQFEADEAGAMAAADEYRSEAMAVEAREEEALGEERLEESEREEALAVVLEEVRRHRTLRFQHDSGGELALREFNLSFPPFFFRRKPPRNMPRQLGTRASPWRRSPRLSPAS